MHNTPSGTTMACFPRQLDIIYLNSCIFRNISAFPKSLTIKSHRIPAIQKKSEVNLHFQSLKGYERFELTYTNSTDHITPMTARRYHGKHNVLYLNCSLRIRRALATDRLRGQLNLPTKCPRLVSVFRVNEPTRSVRNNYARDHECTGEHWNSQVIGSFPAKNLLLRLSSSTNFNLQRYEHVGRVPIENWKLGQARE